MSSVGTFTVAGRRLDVLGVEYTPERFRYVLEVLRASALTDFKLPDGSVEIAALRLMARVLGAEQAPALLAGFLVLAGESWTVDGAKRVASFLTSLAHTDEPTALQGRGEAFGLLANAAFGFCRGDWPQIRHLMQEHSTPTLSRSVES